MLKTLTWNYNRDDCISALHIMFVYTVAIPPLSCVCVGCCSDSDGSTVDSEVEDAIMAELYFRDVKSKSSGMNTNFCRDSYTSVLIQGFLHQRHREKLGGGEIHSGDFNRNI